MIHYSCKFTQLALNKLLITSKLEDVLPLEATLAPCSN